MDPMYFDTPSTKSAEVLSPTKKEMTFSLNNYITPYESFTPVLTGSCFIEFEVETSLFSSHFQINTLGKGMNLLIPSNYTLNGTTVPLRHKREFSPRRG